MRRLLTIDGALLRRPQCWGPPLAILCLLIGVNVLALALGRSPDPWDAPFSLVNNAFVVMIILPVVFLLPVLDLARRDVEGWSAILWVRIPNRTVWWDAKSLVVLGVAGAYAAGVLALGLLTALGLALSRGRWPGGAWAAGRFTTLLAHHGLHPLGALLWSGVLLWGALGGFGMIGLCLTLFGGTAWAGAGMAVIAFGAYALWMIHPAWGVWLPSFQGLLAAHAGVNPHVPADFHIGASLVWDSVLVVLATVVGGWRIARTRL